MHGARDVVNCMLDHPDVTPALPSLLSSHAQAPHLTSPSSPCIRGVLNIVHGTRDVVNWMLDHPDIKAISFVGSDQAGKHIYTRGCAAGKRVQSNMGAKNHAVVMPDADVDSTVKALVGEWGGEGAGGTSACSQTWAPRTTWW